MLKIADYYQGFKEDQEKKEELVVIYGAGEALEWELPYFKRIDYICDRTKTEFYQREVIKPQMLESIGQEFRIVFVIHKNNQDTFEQVCKDLEKLKINATIYNYYDNISFDYFNNKNKKYIVDEKQGPLKINIVCREPGWILSKMANKLYEELGKLGIDVTICNHVVKEADVNHHVQFGENMVLENDTVMISHVDCEYSFGAAKQQLEVARLGICMSQDTMNKLISWGIPRTKLCYINPGQDGIIKPKKYVIGITHRCYKDLRKRQWVLAEIFRELNPQYFKLRIMGDGWTRIVVELREMGYEVDYYDTFDYDLYSQLIPSLDYYMFFGMDEGSMGYMDALAAGVKTIVTPQGFHLDVGSQITHPCITMDEFVAALKSIQSERAKIVESVKPYTWKNYAIKHMEVWEYLMRRKPLSTLYQNQHCYKDGIFSMMLSDLNYL